MAFVACGEEEPSRTIPHQVKMLERYRRFTHTMEEYGSAVVLLYDRCGYLYASQKNVSRYICFVGRQNVKLQIIMLQVC